MHLDEAKANQGRRKEGIPREILNTVYNRTEEVFGLTVLNGKQVYKLWVKAWNGDVSILNEVTSPNCTVHQARLDKKDSEARKGVEALKEMITNGRAIFNDVKMSIEVGPIEENAYVSARWKLTGTYNGEMPGAKANAGEVISFHGMDIFSLEEGKIKDYWVSCDDVHFLQQLGML
ncbi:hypothetical protein F3157_14650 [Virgibacillus dakarensis]|nr:ester cyclase [Virgibacillus dakarensis]MTW86889.1 hypothetical protein [Virgibacillus dakarensis]